MRLKPQFARFSPPGGRAGHRQGGRQSGEGGLVGLLKKNANLTDAEIRLAVALFEGQSLTQHALKPVTTVGTVRQQLKSVFRKTGTGRQAELVTWMRRLQSYDGA